jgi:hypothetical protein
MKKLIVTTLFALVLLATGTSVMAAQQEVIPWTFDDFDHNDELIEVVKEKPSEVLMKEGVTLEEEEEEEEESSELGW